MNEETQDLYALLRDHLRVADTPLTCHDLYDVPEIRAVAPSANRVPDYLGVLFRRGEQKPNIFITEDGGLLNIEMPEISIQIQIKKK